MKKVLFLAVLFIFSLSAFAYGGEYRTSPIRLSVLGAMSDQDGSHWYYYASLPPRVNRVIGLDFGLFASKIDILYGLQLSGVSSIKEEGTGIQLSMLYSYSADIAGLQLSGGLTVNEKMRGLQIGAISSASSDFRGIMFGGLFAVSGDNNSKILQMSAGAVYTGDFTGILFGGIFNYSKNMTGLQASAGFTIASRDVKGIQIAGIGSFADEIKGIQAAVVACYADEIKWVQAAGLFSGAASFTGIQIGGIAAYAGDESTGVQVTCGAGGGSVKGLSIVPIRLFAYQKKGNTGVVASVISFGGDYFGDDYMVKGVHLGGLNIGGGNIKGVQAGAINHATELNGLQIGFINYAKKLDGIQIGVVNIASNAKIKVLPLVNLKF
ncbi:MAG: hypothetical protein FWG57_02410 [Endomicrobia bacterium]|nr:hypothetical protein [Endomicrobiia bacterium]